VRLTKKGNAQGGGGEGARLNRKRGNNVGKTRPLHPLKAAGKGEVQGGSPGGWGDLTKEGGRNFKTKKMTVKT